MFNFCFKHKQKKRKKIEKTGKKMAGLLAVPTAGESDGSPPETVSYSYT